MIYLFIIFFFIIIASVSAYFINKKYQQDTNNKLLEEQNASNLAASNLAASNLVTSNLVASNLAKSNLNNSLSGSKITSSLVAGSRVAGSRVAGSRVAGSRVAGSRVAASRVAGSKVAASNLAVNNTTDYPEGADNTTYYDEGDYPEDDYLEDEYPEDEYPEDEYPEDEYPEDEYQEDESNTTNSLVNSSNLAGSLLAGSRVTGSNLDASRVTGSNLAASNVSGSLLAGSNLAASNVSGSLLAASNVSGSLLAASNLPGYLLNASNLAASNLPVYLLNASNLAGSNLAGSIVAASNLPGYLLAASSVAGSNLAGSNLAASNVGASNLAASIVNGSNVAASNIAGSNLAGSNLGASMVTGSLIAASNLAASNVAGSLVAASNVADSLVAGSNLAGSLVTGSRVAGSNVAGSLVAGSLVAGSRVAGSLVAGSNVAGSLVAGSRVAGSNLAASTVTGSLVAGSNVAGSLVAGSLVAGSNLAGSLVTGSRVAGSNLAGSILNGSLVAGSTVAANKLDSLVTYIKTIVETQKTIAGTIVIPTEHPMAILFNEDTTIMYIGYLNGELWEVPLNVTPATPIRQIIFTIASPNTIPIHFMCWEKTATSKYTRIIMSNSTPTIRIVNIKDNIIQSPTNITIPANALGIDCDSTGNLYISARSAVYKYNISSGVRITIDSPFSVSPALTGGPTLIGYEGYAIYIDDQDNVYFSQANSILMFNSRGGSWTRIYKNPANNINYDIGAITKSKTGYIYVQYNVVSGTGTSMVICANIGIIESETSIKYISGLNTTGAVSSTTTTYAKNLTNQENVLASSGTFATPIMISIDKNDNVYVADRFNHRIRQLYNIVTSSAFTASKIAGSTYYVETVVGTGVAPTTTPVALVSTATAKGTPINHPSGLLFDNQNNMYVGCKNLGGLYKVTPDGKIVLLTTVSNTIYYMCWDKTSNYNIIYMNGNNNIIFKYDMRFPTTLPSAIYTLPNATTKIIGLDCDSTGMLYINTDVSIFKYNTSTYTQIELSLPPPPLTPQVGFPIYIDSTNNVYFSQSNGIIMLSSSGVWSRPYFNNLDYSIGAIIKSSTGEMYVQYNNQNRSYIGVMRNGYNLNPIGGGSGTAGLNTQTYAAPIANSSAHIAQEFQLAESASFGTPTMIALDNNNNIYVADRYNNRVRKIYK
jgi:uncharacterized protein YjbI with pentapeptide repeats